MIPARFRGLCDDAAIFPPGLMPLAEAVPAHLAHRASAYAGLVGPLVLSAAAVAELGPLIEGEQPGALDLSMTVPSPAAVGAALAAADAVAPLARLVAVEIAVPDGLAVAAVLPDIEAALAGRDVQAYVEVPRDARRPQLLEALAGTAHRAKFRTGGVTPDLYPDVEELAAAVRAAVGLRLPFKATAGLHHAIRNTDPETGFDQHGFLNLLLATDAALRDEPAETVAAILADRDAPAIADAVRALSDDRAGAARAAFVSFGTCSVSDPLTELSDLGLVHREGIPA